MLISSLYVHEEEVGRRIHSVTGKISEFIAHRFIWFEGLAWLRLAQNKGFTLPASNIRYCPDEALGQLPERYNGDWLLVPLPT